MLYQLSYSRLIKELEGRKFIQALRYGKYFRVFFQKKIQEDLKKLIILSVAPRLASTKAPAAIPIVGISVESDAKRLSN